MNNYDYKKKLVEKEKTREYARKNWKSIGNIKELKEGYISGVVHEIAMLMVEYNAIMELSEVVLKLNDRYTRSSRVCLLIS